MTWYLPAWQSPSDHTFSPYILKQLHVQKSALPRSRLQECTALPSCQPSTHLLVTLGFTCSIQSKAYRTEFQNPLPDEFSRTIVDSSTTGLATLVP